jgi:hypothetical protein
MTTSSYNVCHTTSSDRILPLARFKYPSAAFVYYSFSVARENLN